MYIYTSTPNPEHIYVCSRLIRLVTVCYILHTNTNIQLTLMHQAPATHSRLTASRFHGKIVHDKNRTEIQGTEHTCCFLEDSHLSAWKKTRRVCQQGSTPPTPCTLLFGKEVLPLVVHDDHQIFPSNNVASHLPGHQVQFHGQAVKGYLHMHLSSTTLVGLLEKKG